MIRRMQNHRFFLSVLLILAGVLANFPQHALAMAGVNLYTTYPGIKIQPGQTINFSIQVENNNSSSRLIPLRLAEVPEGWDAQLLGNSWVLNEVLVPGNDSETVSLKLDVPANAEKGVHTVRVEAGQPGDVSPLELHIEVTEEGGSTAGLTTDFPILSGPSGAEFTFRVELNNNTAQQQMFGLSAQAPEGWSVTFKPSYDNQQIASISLDANASRNLDVTVVPPKDTKAGKYNIPITAQSPQATAKTELQVEITGSYEIELGTADGPLNARAVAGQTSPLRILVKNNGSTDLQNVQLNASAPAEWNVEFEPKMIENLPAGESAEVTARITPNSQAISGDYALTIRASNEAVSDSMDIRVSVRTSTLWGLVGLAIVLIVAGGVVYLFRNYGRR